MINFLFTQKSFLAMERALDATSARAHLIAHNIANADTPNYKAYRLKFEDILAREMGEDYPERTLQIKQTRDRHLPSVNITRLDGLETPVGTIYRDDSTTFRLDGNNVDIDRESAEQARNALHYSALTELASRSISYLRTAVSEGRR